MGRSAAVVEWGDLPPHVTRDQVPVRVLVALQSVDEPEPALCANGLDAAGGPVAPSSRGWPSGKRGHPAHRPRAVAVALVHLQGIGEPCDVPERSPSRGPPYWERTVLRRKALGDGDAWA